jgi:phenolic acid decarboxylase
MTNRVVKYELGGVYIYQPLSVGKILSDNTVQIVDALNNIYRVTYTGTATTRT